MAYAFSAYSGVRALLGVSVKELPNSVLEDDIYSSQLYLDLVGIDADLISTAETAAGESTASALALTAAMTVYTAHAMALFCLPALPNFSPKSVTDGKAGFSRYSDSPYKTLQDNIRAEHARYRKALIDALAVYQGGSSSTTETSIPVAVSSPSYDPITGA